MTNSSVECATCSDKMSFHLNELIVSQFRNPRGAFGAAAGWIMANRSSNIARNHWTVDLLNLAGNSHVLELGCGPGIGLQVALEVGPLLTATGIDHAKMMITQAAHRHKTALIMDRLDLWHGTLFDYPGTRQYNAVFSCNVLQFIDNRRALLQKVQAVLKSGGVFATTYQPRGRCATADDGRAWIGMLAEDLCQAGFHDVEIHEKPFGAMPAFCVLAVKGEGGGHKGGPPM